MDAIATTGRGWHRGHSLTHSPYLLWLAASAVIEPLHFEFDSRCRFSYSDFTMPAHLQTPLFILGFAMLFVGGCVTQPARHSFPEAATLPPQTALPDPLVMLDRRRVTSRKQC